MRLRLHGYCGSRFTGDPGDYDVVVLALAKPRPQSFNGKEGMPLARVRTTIQQTLNRLSAVCKDAAFLITMSAIFRGLLLPCARIAKHLLHRKQLLGCLLLTSCHLWSALQRPQNMHAVPYLQGLLSQQGRLFITAFTHGFLLHACYPVGLLAMLVLTASKRAPLKHIREWNARHCL